MYSADETIKSCEYVKTTENINIDKRLLKPLGENRVTFTPEKVLLISQVIPNGTTVTEHFENAQNALFRICYHYLPEDQKKTAQLVIIILFRSNTQQPPPARRQ